MITLPTTMNPHDGLIADIEPRRYFALVNVWVPVRGRVVISRRAETEFRGFEEGEPAGAMRLAA